MEIDSALEREIKLMTLRWVLMSHGAMEEVKILTKASSLSQPRQRVNLALGYESTYRVIRYVHTSRVAGLELFFSYFRTNRQSK